MSETNIRLLPGFHYVALLVINDSASTMGELVAVADLVSSVKAIFSLSVAFFSNSRICLPVKSLANNAISGGRLQKEAIGLMSAGALSAKR